MELEKKDIGIKKFFFFFLKNGRKEIEIKFSKWRGGKRLKGREWVSKMKYDILCSGTNSL